MLELHEKTHVYLVPMPKWMLIISATAETVECASSTVEDGGRERFWFECEPKPVSANHIYYVQLTI